MSMQLHASCIVIQGKGVLLLGDSGSGKSDLAIRLMSRGAMLVADDQVEITLANQTLYASPPATLRGMVEARGVGIMHVPYVELVPLALAVKLVPRDAVERMPEPAFFDCLGAKLPLLSLHAFDLSTADKICLECGA